MISRWREERQKRKSNVLPTTHPSDNDINANHNYSSNSNPPSPKISTAFRSPKPGTIKKMHINPNAVGCHTFLMGGQYYPGKDKNRLHLRRRTLWYRICWSSPFRRGLSALFILYLSVIYIFNPGFNLLLHYGKILSHHPGDGTDASSLDIDVIQDGGGRGKLGHLKPLKMAKEDAKKIMKRLNEIKNEKMSVEKRKELIRKVIPEWFRHDMHIDSGEAADAGVNLDASAEEIEVEQEGDEEQGEEEQVVDVDADPHADGEANVIHNAKQNADPDPDFDAVEPEVKTEVDPIIAEGNVPKQISGIIRTLRNRTEHRKQSLCPKGVFDISATLVVQSTFDRLTLMKRTCQRWNGPINLVVYLTEDESITLWHPTIEEYSQSCPHLKLIPYIAKSDEERKMQYPINALRNIGLDHVMTSHVLVVDIDLIPSQNLDEAVHSAINLAIEARFDDDGDRGVDPKDAIVVPAFERKIDDISPCNTLQDCQKLSAEDDTFIPKSIEGHEKCIKEEQCIVFQSDVNWEGHFDTKSTEWLERNQTTSLTTLECFRSQRYEPYVILPWCPLEKNARQRLAIRSPRSPYYDERFFGYGKNKIQQISHLRERGYKFHVMPSTGFFVHHPHPESETKAVWNDRATHDLHQKMDALYPKYLQELHKTYEGNHVITPLCQKDRAHDNVK